MIESETLRVLHCIHSLSGGGAERQLGYLLKASGAHGIVSAVLYVNGDFGELQASNAQPYRSIRHNKLNIGFIRNFRSAVKDFKPDIVHVWLPQVVTIPAMLGAFMMGVPCIFSYRNTMKFHRLLTVPEYIAALLFAKRIVTNNPVRQSSRLYRSLYMLKDGVEIGNAVEVDDKYIKRTAANEFVKTVEIVFVGRLTVQKNWMCLLEALVLVDQAANWHLTICGDGEDRAKVESFISAHNLAGRVSLEGYKPDVHKYMSRADLLVLPSWFEGMPNVLLEALYIRLPCIVSDIDIHRDITDNGRLAGLFDPASPKALADMLDGFMKDPAGANGRVDVARKYASQRSPDNMAREYKELYMSVLNR